jgi:tryptophan synthase alpha chain
LKLDRNLGIMAPMKLRSRQNRIDHCFAAFRTNRRKAFVAYITAGDPTLAATAKLVRAFESAGVDIIELGVPFSDPLADGAVNQAAAERALRAGTTLEGIIRMVARLRRQGVRVPIVFFTYFNPIHRYGIARFVRDASRAGVDGILALDLPPEEAAGFTAAMRRAGMHSIRLIAPTTSPRRMSAICRNAGGFIYYVSREGVTGMRKKLAGGIDARIREIRRHTRLPIVVGFGVSTPQQVRATASAADGCVVGSAIVHRIGQIGNRPALVPQIARFVKSLTRPLHR